MEEDEEILRLHLNEIVAGAQVTTIPLDFSVFSKINEVFVERRDKRLYRPLEIFMWKKTSKQIGYDIGSLDRKITIMSNGADWNIAGGEITPDNPDGVRYLKFPLSDFAPYTEARLYSSMNSPIYRVSLNKSATSEKSSISK